MAKTKKRSRPWARHALSRAQPAARATSWRAGLAAALIPPPKLSLSKWADRNFYLSAESSAEPGRWHTLPYQRAILDAITDPAVVRVSVKKSARVGFTKCINVAIAYFMHGDPCPMLAVQPTVEDAEGYSKEEIAPMLRDCKVLADIVDDAGPKTSEQTILHKKFPGGVLSMVGANSGRGFRRISRRVVIFDEVDGYPASAGGEGDPIKLGEKRSEYYWNRKIIAGSTPLVAGTSRIEELFLAGDQRRYHVPCPHCGHKDFLVFDPKSDRGHVMTWGDDPANACFKCRACGSAIEERHKRDMVEAGEWIADAEFTGHASFHIWAAYSLSPNATWAQIAAEFLEAKNDPEKLKTFVNTTLGETWQERGEAPDWERLYERRETYPIGTVPVVPIRITAGVDVQIDRLMYEVVAWLDGRESYSVEAGAFYGNTALEAGSPDSPWDHLDELLSRTYPVGDDGEEQPIAMLAIDSGYNTQVVYRWARRYSMSRVIACKGSAEARELVGKASPVEVTVNGRRLQRGYKIRIVGVNIAKAELYGWLRLPRGAGDPPPGYCHFPQYGDDFFKQITAEHLVSTENKKTRQVTRAWHVLPNRENHFLDARILARAAAYALGIDRARKPKAPAPKPAAPAPVGTNGEPIPALPPTVAEAVAPRAAVEGRSGFWKEDRPKRSPKRRRGFGDDGWFARRRR